MNRREFLSAAGTTGGSLALLGIYCGQNLHARSQLEERLIRESGSILTEKALAELRDIPAKGKSAIQIWFHTPCLAGAEFAYAVTTDDFRQRIANCDTQEEQQLEFLLAFERHVVSAESMLNHVQIIAEELGSELDLDWEECCQTLVQKWNVHVRHYGSALTEGFAHSLEPMIRESLQKCLDVAKSGGQRPALGETIGAIGESALRLLPMARIPAASPFFLPCFVIEALGHMFFYVDGLWKRDRSMEYIQAAVSKRLALLANRIGNEFESELRSGVTRLHQWQEHAVKNAAGIRAEEAVSVF